MNQVRLGIQWQKILKFFWRRLILKLRLKESPMMSISQGLRKVILICILADSTLILGMTCENYLTNQDQSVILMKM